MLIANGYLTHFEGKKLTYEFFKWINLILNAT